MQEGFRVREAPALQLQHGRWAAVPLFCTGTLWAANVRVCTCVYARQAEGGSARVVSLARLLAWGGWCDPVQFAGGGSGRYPALAWCNATQQPFAGSGGHPRLLPRLEEPLRAGRCRPGRRPRPGSAGQRPPPRPGYRIPPRGSGLPALTAGRGLAPPEPPQPVRLRSCKKGIENAARALRLP